VLYLHTSSTYEDALNLFTVYKVHRIYIVDEDIAPIGMLTMTDMLQIAVRELNLKS
jgi:CBS domain-containing protein